MKALSLLLLLWPLLLSGGVSTPESGVFILKQTAVVSDKVIRIKDIALMDDVTAGRFGNLVIGASPELGGSGAVSKKEISEKLKGNGAPFPRLEGPDSIAILRRGRIVSAADFTELAAQYIREHSSWNDGFTVEIVYSKQLTVPESGVSWRLTPANGQDFFGSVLFKLEGVSEETGETIVSDWLSARLRIIRSVPVTNRLIMKDEVFTPGDLRWEERELTAFTRDAVLGPEHILGRKAGRTIRPNAVVTASLMEKQYLVRRGAEASLTAVFKNLKATSRVKVLADGLAGDTVRVMNTNSMKIISATVTGPNQLEVIVQ